jgi:hypothetical protein
LTAGISPKDGGLAINIFAAAAAFVPAIKRIRIPQFNPYA